MLKTDPLVFLLDVDNTLLDNDRFGADLSARLDQDFGRASCSGDLGALARADFQPVGALRSGTA